MNRVFQSKTDFGSYLLLAFALTATVWSMWNKTGLIYGPCIVLVITESGKLIIQRGRLAKEKSIVLQSIARIDQVCRFHIGGKPFGQYLIIVLGSGEQVAVRPKNETAFVEFITKRRRQIDHETADSGITDSDTREEATEE